MHYTHIIVSPSHTVRDGVLGKAKRPFYLLAVQDEAKHETPGFLPRHVKLCQALLNSTVRFRTRISPHVWCVTCGGRIASPHFVPRSILKLFINLDVFISSLESYVLMQNDPSPRSPSKTELQRRS